MDYPLFSPDGKPLYSRGRKPMLGPEAELCTCCDGNGPCAHTPLEADECLEALSCLHHSWFIIEPIWEDSAKANWSVLNGLKLLQPPICLYSLSVRLSHEYYLKIAARIQASIPPEVIACCETGPFDYGFSFYVVFNCADGTVKARLDYGTTSTGTDAENDGCRMYGDFEFYFNLPESLPVSGEVTIPVARDCAHDLDPEDPCDCPNIVAFKLTQLTGCDNPCPSDFCDCPPVAQFALDQIGGCLYRPVNTSTPGCCAEEDITYYWTDGVVGRDRDDNPWSGTSKECGEGEGVLGLVAVNKAGCYSYFEQKVTCCACDDADGDPCANPPGILTITPHETDPCCYYLSPPADEAYTGTCSNDWYIEWRLGNAVCSAEGDCTCEEIEAGTCGGSPGCSGFLTPGAGDYTLCIESATTLYWRSRETACGCWGPWNEEQLTCINCACCDKAISNVAVTLAGTTENSSCAGCPDADGTYLLSSTDGCLWEINIPDVFSCTCEGSCTRSVQIFLNFTCDGDKIYVTGNVTADSNISFTKEVDVSGAGPWQCDLLEGAMTLYDDLAGGCNPPTSITLSFDYA